MIWKYEFLVNRSSRGDDLVLDSGEFKARDLTEAKTVAACAAANIRVDGLLPPNAIRLINPLGKEVWRTAIVRTRRTGSNLSERELDLV